MDYPSSSYPKGISHSMRKQYYETLTEIYKRSECIMLIDKCIGAEKTTEITEGVLACGLYEIKNGLEDVKKARWYLDRLLMHIAKRERKKKKKHKRGAKK